MKTGVSILVSRKEQTAINSCGLKTENKIIGIYI